MIKVTLNNKSIEIKKSITLNDFLKSNNYAPKGFAVAINREFIPRGKYDSHFIHANDEIEIVAPMQGG